MEIINLTPHTLNIMGPEGDELLQVEPSGKQARINVSYEASGSVDVDGADLPVYTAQYGEVSGLPEPKDDTIYVVSGMVNANIDRDDVFSPGDLVRDEDGKPVGCKGLKA